MAGAHTTKRTATTLTRSEEDMAPQGAGPIQNVGQGERIVSGIVGGLLLHALSPRSMVSGLAFIVGAGLLYRAFTGHCPLYEMTEASMGASADSAGPASTSPVA